MRTSLTASSVPSPKSLGLRCVQNGPPARREEGAYLNRYVTDEQRGRRPIFNATLRAAAGWLFFRVARSARMDLNIAASLATSNASFGRRPVPRPRAIRSETFI